MKKSLGTMMGVYALAALGLAADSGCMLHQLNSSNAERRVADINQNVSTIDFPANEVSAITTSDGKQYALIDGTLYISLPDLKEKAGELGLDLTVKYFGMLLPGDNITATLMTKDDKGQPKVLEVLTQDIDSRGDYHFPGLKPINTAERSLAWLEERLQKETNGTPYGLVQRSGRIDTDRRDNNYYGNIVFLDHQGNGQWQSGVVDLPVCLSKLTFSKFLGVGADIIAVSLPYSNVPKGASTQASQPSEGAPYAIKSVMAFASLDEIYNNNTRHDLGLPDGAKVLTLATDTDWNNFMQTLDQAARLAGTVKAIVNPIRCVMDDWKAIREHIDPSGESGGYMKRLDQIGKTADTYGKVKAVMPK